MGFWGVKIDFKEPETGDREGDGVNYTPVPSTARCPARHVDASPCAHRSCGPGPAVPPGGGPSQNRAPALTVCGLPPFSGLGHRRPSRAASCLKQRESSHRRRKRRTGGGCECGFVEGGERETEMCTATCDSEAGLPQRTWQRRTAAHQIARVMPRVKRWDGLVGPYTQRPSRRDVGLFVCL